jgi:putative transposase
MKAYDLNCRNIAPPKALDFIRIRSRSASPYDNAQAESFIKTLKYEEVYRTEYRNLEEARASIAEFLEKIYNQERLHSTLGYRPPLEFECGLRRAHAAGKGPA